MAESTVSVLPENIRKNLAKSNEHHNFTCLECGYSGLMGVSRHVNHWRWPLVAIAAVWAFFLIYTFGFAGTSAVMDDVAFLLFYSFPGWVYLLGGFALMFFVRTIVAVFLCPNCEREISRQ